MGPFCEDTGLCYGDIGASYGDVGFSCAEKSLISLRNGRISPPKSRKRAAKEPQKSHAEKHMEKKSTPPQRTRQRALYLRKIRIKKPCTSI